MASRWCMPIGLHDEITRTHNLLRSVMKLVDWSPNVTVRVKTNITTQETVGMLNFRNNDPVFFCG
jgi:hypothetical protein